MGTYWVLLDLLGLTLALMGLTAPFWALLSNFWVLLGLNCPYWACLLLALQGLIWALLCLI